MLIIVLTPLLALFHDDVMRPSPSQTRLQDETLNFLSATLGDHMVLQQAPQSAVIWGFTAPATKVTTTMSSSNATMTLSTVSETDGTWRQTLPPTPASKTAFNFKIVATAANGSTVGEAEMDDVLFGEVYICGGQSNMEFAMPAVTNSSVEQQLANLYPTIRFMSVGHRTSSPTPLRDLQTIWEPWQVASNESICRDFSSYSHLFSTFSAVCWMFGKRLSEELSPTGDVPVGLISNK